MLTQGNLKTQLNYDSQTGKFCWCISRGKARAGANAGTVMPNGYVRLGINNKLYLAHRLAWLYVYGEFPESEIDHINGDRADNRISNLRLATSAENSQNMKRYASNTSGFPGVYFNKNHNKYYARINYSGMRKHLGFYDTAELAFGAYKEAKRVFHHFNPDVSLSSLSVGVQS